MLKSLFKPNTTQAPGESLYAQAVQQARNPAFYTDMGVADRIDARFELYTLHVLLLILRLRDEGGEGQPALQGMETAQAVFDTYVSALDNALRELGVGDISMARKMRNLGEALYGRMITYDTVIRAEDLPGLDQALARNVFEVEPDARSAKLADYTLAARQALAGQELEAVLTDPAWIEVIS